MERKKENEKNIRKGEVISLWNRPGKGGFREEMLDDVYKVNNLRGYRKKRDTKVFVNYNVLTNARYYYITLPIHAVLQKEYLTCCYTLFSPLRTALNNTFPALLWLCSLFPSRWEGKQLQTGLLQWYQTPWLSLFQSRHGYPSNQLLCSFFIFSLKTYKLVYID